MGQAALLVAASHLACHPRPSIALHKTLFLVRQGLPYQAIDPEEFEELKEALAQVRTAAQEGGVNFTLMVVAGSCASALLLLLALNAATIASLIISAGVCQRGRHCRQRRRAERRADALLQGAVHGGARPGGVAARAAAGRRGVRCSGAGGSVEVVHMGRDGWQVVCCDSDWKPGR